MKVDLDALEATAKAMACPGKWALSEPVRTVNASEDLYNVLTEAGGAPMFEFCIREHARYAIAARTDVVLALIARIRDLEAAVAVAYDLTHEEGSLGTYCMEGDVVDAECEAKAARWEAAMLSIGELHRKGALR